MTDDILDGYIGSGVNLKLAYKKYGKENFMFKILYFCEDEDELNEMEVIEIAKYKLAGFRTYNIAEGGEGSTIKYLSEESKIKWKEKISKAKTGKKLTEEHKAKLGLKGKWNPMYGKTHTSEAREKMRQLRIGKSSWNKGLKGVQVGWNKGKIFSNTYQAQYLRKWKKGIKSPKPLSMTPKAIWLRNWRAKKTI